MESSKFLKIVIVILLLINISTLGFMFMQNSPHGMPPHRPDAGVFLSHELNFNSDQEKQLDQLRNENRSVIEALRENGKNVHDQFFDLLNTSPIDSALVSSKADSICSNQKQIELATFYHFQKVRAICTPEQKKEFDEIIKDALRMMAPRRGPGR